jgi:hypothetical protein
MDKVDVDGATLAYEVSGTGEPVILIHGALIAEAFRPLLTQPSLGRGYKLIRPLTAGHCCVTSA